MAGFASIFDGALKGLIKQGPARSEGRGDTRSGGKGSARLPVFGRATTENPRHAADLAKMVEAEIIPRLMLSHRTEMVAPEAAQTTAADSAFGPDERESFARMVLSEDSDSIIAFVGGLLQSGVPMESIYVDLMVPAARRLGEYWDDDNVSFADVTIGLGRLQQVVRTLQWKPAHPGGSDHSAPSALFVPAPNEQHMFGLFIIEESFRRAGWRTWIETSGFEADSLDMVGHHWFDLIGLSASGDADVEQVTAAVTALREASRNPGLFILVGGRLFIDRPELVSVVGADATAPNGADALLVAHKAVRRLSSVA